MEKYRAKMKKGSRNTFYFLLFTFSFAFVFMSVPDTVYGQGDGPTDTISNTEAPTDTISNTEAPTDTITNPSSGTFTLQNPLRVDSVGGAVQAFLEIFTYIVIIFAVLMLVWVGLQFILAQGNADRIKELKKQLTWLVVGIAIVIGARLIVQVVINTLKATGTVSPGVIENADRAIRVE